MDDYESSFASEKKPLLNPSSYTKYESFDDNNTSHAETILKWNNISYSVENKAILTNISGHANKGELLGIIGSSGSGKTTLISVLSGKIYKISSLKHKDHNSKLNGKILYKNYIGNLNNSKENTTLNILSNNVSIVLQEDLLYQTEKAKEVITFSAIMRIKNRDHSERIEAANKVIKDLELEECADTWIGGDRFRGISGGERKRVSIGVELVKSSELLFLDEPTTGLDSNTAYGVMENLRHLCKKNNSSMICTLHQPSSQLFKLLDRVIVLTEGQIIYSGYTNQFIKYLNSINYKCPKYHNVSDYIIRLLNKSPETFIKHWNNQNNKYKQLSERKDTITQDDHFTSNINHIIIQQDFHMVPMKDQLYYLFKRNLLITVRDPPLFIAKILPFAIVGFLALMWMNIKPLTDYSESIADLPRGYSDALSRYGAVFSVIVFVFFQPLLISMITFQQYKIIFEKERTSNYYYSTIWLFTKSTIDIIISIIGSIIFVAIAYAFFDAHASFSQILFSAFLVAINADSVGLIIGCFCDTMMMSVLVTTQVFILFWVTADFLIIVHQMKWYIRWVAFINPLYYGVQTFAIKEFNNVNIYGDQVMDLFNVKPNNYYLYIYILVILFIVYRVTAFAILAYKNGW